MVEYNQVPNLTARRQLGRRAYSWSHHKEPAGGFTFALWTSLCNFVLEHRSTVHTQTTIFDHNFNQHCY